VVLASNGSCSTIDFVLLLKTAIFASPQPLTHITLATVVANTPCLSLYDWIYNHPTPKEIGCKPIKKGGYEPPNSPSAACFAASNQPSRFKPWH
jgi:hypothetical protein